MSSGVKATLEMLSETANEAAVPVLLAALDSSDRIVQDSALEALLARRRGAGPRGLVRRWNRLNERWKTKIAQHPRYISAAVRHAILSTDGEVCANGCDALLRIGEFDLIPALVTSVEESNNPYVPLVAETLLALSEQLQEEISGPRDQKRIQDPVRVCHQVLPSLEQAVDRFEHHRRSEVVESFLLLTNHENPVLKRILGEPRHPAYLMVMDILGKSTRVAIIRVILNLLEDRFAPSAILQVVSRRSDPTFVRHLLKRVAAGPSKQMKSNLRRVDSIVWLEGDLGQLDGLTDKEQGAAVKLAVASGLNRLEAFEVIKTMVRGGRVGGRRAASSALANFGGAEANKLVLDGLQDQDAQVQANMAAQLRERGIPGAISKLIRLLDSRQEVVRDAAQSCLSEFNFNRYITVFDMMEDDIRRSTGMLIMRIDPDAATQLAAEFKARARTRRLRALEVARAMDAVHVVEPLIIGLLTDQDHFVRAEAARTLSYCNTLLAQQSLRQAIMDKSVAVREAAEQALRKLSEAGRITTAGTFAAALQHAEYNPLIEDSPANGSGTTEVER